MKIINWEQPSEEIVLLDDEIHLWRVNLDISSEKIAELSNNLSLDEIARANHFKFEEHKNHFIAARGFLRQIISNYLQILSNEIVFNYSDRGKPSIQNDNLQFNISHSQDLALYAFCHNHLIGVDLEYLRDDVEYDKIAQRFFTPAESEFISKLSLAKQKQTFFHFWTIKEAYLKATGEGLGGGLETVEIDCNADLEVQVKAIFKSGLQNNDWFFSSFIPQNDFIATVAINTDETELKIKYFALN